MSQNGATETCLIDSKEELTLASVIKVQQTTQLILLLLLLRPELARHMKSSNSATSPHQCENLRMLVIADQMLPVLLVVLIFLGESSYDDQNVF